MEKIKIEQNAMCGGFWFVGWLFSIGILDMGFQQGFFALVLWPYYLGKALTAFL